MDMAEPVWVNYYPDSSPSTTASMLSLSGRIQRALEVKELLSEHVMETIEQLPLDGVHGPFEAVEQLGGVLVVHEEAVVEVEAVTAGVVDEPEQRLVALGADGRGLEVQQRQHPADGVGEELRLGGVLVVLGAGHLHHAAALAREDVEERLGAGAAGRAVADADPVEDEREAGPAVARGLRAEHGVRADDVEVVGEVLKEELLGELLHGEHVDEEGVAAEAVDREREDDGLGGEDGRGEEDHVRVALAQVVRVGEEGRADGRCGGGVVGPGVRQDGVALRHERARQELAVVAEPHDGDPEARRLVLLILLGRRMGRRLDVIKLARGVRGAEAVGRGGKTPPLACACGDRACWEEVGGNGQAAA
ncbi:hypothetical protein EJB05_41031, partial [Eragrostis curvula]